MQVRCNKCKVGLPAEGDSWCTGCSALELAQSLLGQRWQSPGVRKIAEEALITSARLVRAFSQLDRTLPVAAAGSRAESARPNLPTPPPAPPRPVRDRGRDRSRDRRRRRSRSKGADERSPLRRRETSQALQPKRRATPHPPEEEEFSFEEESGRGRRTWRYRSPRSTNWGQDRERPRTSTWAKGSTTTQAWTQEEEEDTRRKETSTALQRADQSIEEEPQEVERSGPGAFTLCSGRSREEDLRASALKERRNGLSTRNAPRGDRLGWNTGRYSRGDWRKLESPTEAYDCPGVRPCRSRLLAPQAPSSWISTHFCRWVHRGIRCGRVRRAGEGEGDAWRLHLAESALSGDRRKRFSCNVYSVFQKREDPDSSLLRPCYRLPRVRRRGLPHRQVCVVSSRRLQRTMAQQCSQEGSERRCKDGRRRGEGRWGRGASAVGFHEDGGSIETAEREPSCHLRWGRGAKQWSHGRWRAGDTPGWCWAWSSPLHLRTKSLDGRQGEAGDNRHRLGFRQAAEKEEVIQFEECGRPSGSSSHRETSPGRKEGEKEEPQQITQEAFQRTETEEATVKLPVRFEGEQIREVGELVREPDTTLEEKGPERSGVCLPAIRATSDGTVGTRWCDGGGLHDRVARGAASEDLHLLPAGVEAGAGHQVEGLQRDQSLGAVLRHAKRRPLGQFGRHFGRKAAGGGNGHKARMGHCETPRGVWPRGGGAGPASYPLVGPTPPEAGGESRRKRQLAKKRPMELGRVASRQPSQGQGQRRQRKRQTRQRKEQGEGQRRCGRGDREQSKRRRSLNSGNQAAEGSLPGDTTFESQVPPVAEAAMVSVPTRPSSLLEVEAAGPGSGEVAAAAGLRCPAVPTSKEAWFARLTQCKCLSEIGMALAWGLNAGFIPLTVGCARPTRPAGSRNRTSGLFPLPVEMPDEIVGKGDLSFLDHGNPSFSPLAVKCWRAVSNAALNAYYGCPFTLTGVRAGKVHAAARRNMYQKLERFLKHDRDFGICFDDVKKEVKEKKVSYTGEEVSQPLPLSVNQIVGGLPPRGHGASVPVEPFVVGRTKFLLEHPLECLRDSSERADTPCQARVHIKAGSPWPFSNFWKREGLLIGFPQVLPLVMIGVPTLTACLELWNRVALRPKGNLYLRVINELDTG